MLDNVKKAFAEIGKAASKFRETDASLAARLKALSEQRHALLRRHVSRADYARVLCSHIDTKADEECGNFVAFLQGNALGKGVYTWLKDGGATAHNVLHITNGVVEPRGLLSHSDIASEAILEMPAMFLFREQIKAAITQAVQAMKWPFADCTPLDEILAGIEAIDTEVKDLTEQRRELHQQAREVGISLAPRAIDPASGG